MVVGRICGNEKVGFEPGVKKCEMDAESDGEDVKDDLSNSRGSKSSHN